jgi:hypothetical protein
MGISRLFLLVFRQLRHLLPQGAVALVFNLALMVVALAQSPNCHLATLATVLPIDGQRENLIQRLRRWLASPHLDWERYYRPLITQLFAHWNGAEVALVMDRTDLNDRASILYTGIATQQRVVLLAWDILPYGSTDTDVQIRQLQRIAALMPDPQQHRITFFGDAEFRAVELQQFCRRQGWHWHVGVKSDTRFHQGDGIWRPLRAIPVQPGERHYLNGLTLTEQHAFGPVNLIIDWSPNADAPRYWVLDQVADRHAWRRGRKRFWIEPTNRDLKRAGFGLEDSALTDSARLSSLFLALAVTFLWMLHLGQWVSTSGHRTRLEAAQKQDYSLFRLGRDWLRRALVRGWSIPVGWTVHAGAPSGLALPGPSHAGRRSRRRTRRVVHKHATPVFAAGAGTPAAPQPCPVCTTPARREHP